MLAPVSLANRPLNRRLDRSALAPGADCWTTARTRFLERIDGGQRERVSLLLQQPKQGGRGLRLWVHRVETEECPLPETLPASLVQVYLDRPDAIPLHDCEECGIAIPVETNWHGDEEEPQQLFFTACPCCGGRTGLHAYWSRKTSGEPAAFKAEEKSRRPKPR